MALSNKSREAAKLAFEREGFSEDTFKSTYGSSMDDFLDNIDNLDAEETERILYDYYSTKTTEDNANKLSQYMADKINHLQEMSRTDDEIAVAYDKGAKLKKVIDERAAEQRRKEFEGLVTKPIPVVNPTDNDTLITKNYLKEYGNNFFELYTYDPSVNNGKNDGLLRLAGVLRQIPSFSMSTNWGAGPAKSLSDIVKHFMCSDVMEMVTTIGGYDRSWTQVDEGSDRTYENTSEPTFDLEFRCYTTENIGSQGLTTWKNWIKCLSLYAQPSIASNVNINAMGNNAVNGVLGAFDKVTQVASDVGKLASGNIESNDSVISAIVDTVADVVNDAAVLVTSRDDENRVKGPANKNNYYGAKLWKLRIMPGIIQRPINVYISNWSVTYSKEINVTTKEPIYVDFKINCNLDQIPNAGRWMYYMNKEMNDKGVGINATQE